MLGAGAVLGAGVVLGVVAVDEVGAAVLGARVPGKSELDGASDAGPLSGVEVEWVARSSADCKGLAAELPEAELPAAELPEFGALKVP